MKNRSAALVWLTLALLLMPPAIPDASGRSSAGHPGAAGGAPFFAWHDKPLRPMPSPAAWATGSRITGSVRVLMLCVEFTNVVHSASHTPGHHEGLADGPAGSMATYFREASGGLLTLTAEAFGWYCSTQTMEHYGTPSGNDRDDPLLYQLVTEAVEAADAVVNFADYDQNGDGFVDYLQVVHAGGDEAVTGNPNDIWSEMYYDLDQPLVDGKRIGPYTLVSEHDPMGVMAHEFGHSLGLPDLYDTDGTGSGGDTDGGGLWDIMAAGAYLNGGATPSLPSAWSRILAGWADVVTVTSNRNGITLISATQNATVLRINVPDNVNEYFLVECRAALGYDSFLPGSGLLIWHIDESKGSINQNNLEVRPGKKRVTLEEAHGGLQHLDVADMNYGDARDPWYSTGPGFGPTSDPNSTAYLDGRHTFVSVKNISPPGGVMSCDVQLDTPVYDLRMTPSDTQVKVDPGTVFQITVDLFNRGSPDNFSFSMPGGHEEWFTIEPPYARLPAQGVAGISVLVHPPLTTPANLTSSNTFKATPASDTSRYFSFKVSTLVNPKSRSAFTPSQDIVLRAGEPRQLNITLANLGNIPDTIAMQLSGDGRQWVSYEGPANFSLSPWTNVTIQLLASIPWGTAENARSYLQIGGRSRDGTSSGAATINFTAASSLFVEIDSLSELHVRPGVPSPVMVNLTNAGTSDALLQLATTIDEGWYANLTQTLVSVPAWSTQMVGMILNPAPDAPAGHITSLNFTAYTAGYSNSTSILVTVDQVFAAVLADCSTAAEVLPGTTHEYRFLVRNTGNGRDELRFGISEGEGGERWTESLDAEPARLGPGEAALILLAISAPLGAAAGQDWHLNLSVVHTGGKAETFEIVTTVARVQSITLGAQVRAKSGLPGDRVQFALTVGNAGNAPDSVDISVPKSEGLSYELGQEVFELAPGQTGAVQFACRILSGARAGQRSVNLTASSRTDRDASAILDLKVTVNAVYDAELQFRETNKECAAGSSVVFLCTVINKGNARDTFHIAKASGTLEVRSSPAQLVLGPGERATVNVTVSVDGGEDGGAHTVKLSLRSAGKSAEVFLKEVTVDVIPRNGVAAAGMAIPLSIAVACAVVAAAGAAWYLRKKKAQVAIAGTKPLPKAPAKPPSHGSGEQEGPKAPSAEKQPGAEENP